MSTFESIEEILNFAVQREEDSIEMYLELAKQIKDPNIAEIFQEFAKEEVNHKNIILFEILKTGKAVDFQEDINITVDTPQQQDEKKLIDLDFKDALAVAIKKEEMAFRMYADIAVKTKNVKFRKILAQLAQEEARHKQKFQQEYEKLSPDFDGNNL